MKIKVENIATATALLLSVALHAAVIGGIGLGMGMGAGNSRPESPVKMPADRPDSIDVSLEVLPYVPETAEKTKLSSRDGTNEQDIKKDEFGGNKGEQKIDAARDAGREMLSYNDSVKQRIQASRKYPQEARRRGTEGRVLVGFYIARDGSASGEAVEQSSGDASLDTEAAATIRRASPFQKLPDSAPSDRLKMRVSIVFKLN